MESIVRYTAIVKKLQDLNAEAKQAFESGVVNTSVGHGLLEANKKRFLEIRDEIYAIGELPNTGNVLLDHLLNQIITMVYTHYTVRHGSLGSGELYKLRNIKTFTGVYNGFWYQQYFELSTRSGSLIGPPLDITPLESLIDSSKTVDPDIHTKAPSYRAAFAYVSTMKALHANDPTERILKLEQHVNAFNADAPIQRIETLERQYVEQAHETLNHIEVLEQHIRDFKKTTKRISTLEQQVKDLQEDNTILKAKLSSIEQAIGLDVKYDYDEISSRIEPYRNELLLTQRIFARILRGRYSLPIAIAVEK
jgi:hypothetical protein